MQLGYVGLGNMGAALARRLLRKDKMRVYDLRPGDDGQARRPRRHRQPEPQGAGGRERPRHDLPADLQGGARGHLRQRWPGLRPEEGRHRRRHDDRRPQRHAGDGQGPRQVRHHADRCARQRRPAWRGCRHHRHHGRRAGRRLCAGQAGLRDHQSERLPLRRRRRRSHHEARQQRRGRQRAHGHVRGGDHGHQEWTDAGGVRPRAGEGIGAQLHHRDHAAQIREGRAEDQLHARAHAQGCSPGNRAGCGKRFARCRSPTWCGRSSRSR